MSDSSIKTLSLFSGAGGLDIGFDMAGFDIVACVELEEKYSKTLLKNREIGKYFNKNTKIHNIDIRKFNVAPYKNKNIECIIGGPPCQTFSAAGRRSGGVIGTDDLRGQLYEVYCKILDEISPKVFVFENVYGLPSADGGKPWKEIQKAFSDHGYNISTEVVDAADYGVPQHRERLIMVGTKSSAFSFPAPTFGPDSTSGKKLVSVNDAIKNIQSKKEPFSDGLGGLYGHLLPDVPEGLNYAYFTAEMGHPEPVFAWRSKFHDLLYKVNRNQPCRTLKANPGKFTGPLHWKNRHFTVDELKRLQTFPDDYEIVGSYGQAVGQIGNSVPPKLAKVIAESIKEQLLRPKDILDYKLREPDFKSTFRQRQRQRSKEFATIAKTAIKKKYGKLKVFKDLESIKPLAEKYYVIYEDKFSREKLTKKPSAKQNSFSCILTEIGSHIRLDMDEINSKGTSPFEIEIKVTGLKKYLPQFDTLTLSASVNSEEFIFMCWKEIEKSLVDRSNFFTLIDIYGHYANRGAVVEIQSEIRCNSNAVLIDLIRYFNQTINCGYFISEESLLKKFNLEKSEFYLLVEKMRGLRFDIRTYNSHPIIGKGNTLCAYPFPLLSPKALVESKVLLNKDKINERQTRAA